jgi:hypothetical protein
VKKYILIILLSGCGLSILAQDSTSHRTNKAERKQEKHQRINSIIKMEEEGNLSFKKQNAFGIELRTNGYGIFYELGKRISPRFSNLYSIEITEIKHAKEEKLQNQNFFSNSYVYGKENNFYQAKLGFGQQYILGQKGNKNGIAVIASFQGGLSMGFLKPYMLDVTDSAGISKSITYEQDSITFLSLGPVSGSSGFTKGWNKVKLKPGLYLKAALRFDFGRYNEAINAIEIGMSVEAYSQKIPILVYTDPKQLFFQGHIAFVFGRRK